MNLRNALSFAIDYLRSREVDDVDARRCTKTLEAKLMRLRARETKGLSMIPQRCHCGEVKEAKAVVCPECYPFVPMKLLYAAQLGRPKARTRALNQIRIACQTRGQRAEEAA